jgi:hypothetical protein
MCLEMATAEASPEMVAGEASREKLEHLGSVQFKARGIRHSNDL